MNEPKELIEAKHTFELKLEKESRLEDVSFVAKPSYHQNQGKYKVLQLSAVIGLCKQ